MYKISAKLCLIVLLLSNSAAYAQQFENDLYNSMQKHFNNSFKMFDNDVFYEKTELKTNKIQLKEENDKYIVKIQLSKLDDEKNININAEDSRITISGKQIKEKQGIKSESNFYQSFGLNKEIDITKITRKRENNTLNIVLPKKQLSETKQQKEFIPKMPKFPNMEKDFI